MRYLTIVAIAGLSFTLTSFSKAQNQAASTTANGQASASTASNVSAELTKKVDTKNAAVGDQVMARTTAAATLSDGTKLPKGTQIIGHVTDVQAKSKADSASHLAFSMDRAILRDGREIPIHAMLTSVVARPTAMAEGSTDDGFSSPIGSAGVGGGGAARSGGGLVGGVGRAAGGGLSSAGGLAGGTVATAGGGVDSMTRTTGNVAGGAATAMNGNGVAIANLPGVMMSGSTNASESGSFQAKNRNVSLDSGTTMNFNVAAAAH